MKAAEPCLSLGEMAWPSSGVSTGCVLTGSWSDVRHVNQRSRVLDEGLMMDRHARAEALRVSCLAEFCVSHRNGGFVFTCGKQSMQV